MTSVDKIGTEKLYEDARRFEELSWENPNYREAAEELEAERAYTHIGKGKYRSVFHRADLPGEEETVVKFPHRVYKPEESNQHNLDEYEAWNTMGEKMRDDFAEVLECGEEGEYLVQRRSEGRDLLGTIKLRIKYRFSDHPSEDIGVGNTGVVDGENVVLDYPWGQID